MCAPGGAALTSVNSRQCSVLRSSSHLHDQKLEYKSKGIFIPFSLRLESSSPKTSRRF